MPRFLSWLHELLWNRPGLSLAAVGVLSALSFYMARRLTFSSDISHILPRSSPAVEGVGELLHHFSFTGQLFVYLEKTHPDASDQAGQQMVERMATLIQRSPDVTRVDWKLTREAEQFILGIVESHGPLLLQDEDFERFLQRMETAEIRERVKRNRRRLASPGPSVADVLMQRDPLDLWLDFYIPVTRAAMPAGKMDTSQGYFHSPDHNALFMLVEGREPPHNIEFCRKIMAQMDSAEAEARREVPGADGWRVSFLGGYPVALANESAIKGDLRLTILSSIPPVLLMLLISLRRWSALVVGFVALNFGILWTFGLAGVAFGHLTGVTVGFAGLLAGMGIDFTIHLVNRFRHERHDGTPAEEASRRTYFGAGGGIFIAMATSVAALLCLWVSDFKGLREFATLVGFGLFLVFVATVLSWPILTRLLNRSGAPDRDIPWWATAACWMLFLAYNAWSIWQMPALGTVSAAACLIFMTARGERVVTALVVRNSWVGGTLGAAATVVALIAVAPAPTGLPIRETDVKNLRNDGDTLLETQERMRQSYSSGLDPLLLISRGTEEGEVLEKLDLVARELREGRRRAPHGDPIRDITIQSITDFVPAPSRQRRHAEALAGVDADRVIADLDAALDREGFDPEAFADAKAWLRSMLSARQAVLPSQIDNPFFGSIRGRFLGRPSHDGVHRALTWVTPRDPLHIMQVREHVIDGISAHARRGDPGSNLCGFSVVVKELDDRIAPEIFKATLAAAGLTCVLAALLFLSPGWALLALLPGIVGTLWLVGSFRLLDLRMNYLNLIVFPLMMGMGTDNGLHLVARYRELGCRDTARAVSSLWRGLTLTSLTTVIGFGSLAFAANRAMKSLGLAISIGMLCYLLASLLILPPILVWLERRRDRAG